MERLTLNSREQARLQVLNQVLEGQSSVVQAAGLLALSERHVWRLLAAYRREGAATLAHGNRGRKPARAVRTETKERVWELAQGTYAGLNHCHLTEVLKEREGIHLSRSTLRRILLANGVRSPRRRRPPKHRSRRERYPQEGMLLQIDGSKHDWLGGRGPHLTLVGAIDDATGTVPYALFREQEDAQGYFLLLQGILQGKGLPLALYSDRHSIFQVNPKQRETLQEQLSGKRPLTQFGRALDELGIHPIFALSPQAKGRIERLWGTLQDRLVSELRLAAGASTLEEANRVLWAYLPRFNSRFGVPAAKEGLAYRKPEPTRCLEEVLCFKYQRTVAADNTVSFGRHTLQLIPEGRLSYTHARVEVQERLDGSLVVVYQGQVVATREAPPHAVTLRARTGARGLPHSTTLAVPDTRNSDNGAKKGPQTTHNAPGKPAPDHPWRKTLLTKSLNN